MYVGDQIADGIAAGIVRKCETISNYILTPEACCVCTCVYITVINVIICIFKIFSIENARDVYIFYIWISCVCGEISI